MNKVFIGCYTVALFFLAIYLISFDQYLYSFFCLILSAFVLLLGMGFEKVDKKTGAAAKDLIDFQNRDYDRN
ncbi:hypothetical protein Phi39:1_gp34 [Cellulophaga phage phi39:1]|uniref:hypothetical protein n=1 Tax=Cellulophaga phage phi39:1 TaxID=1327993 RepID=UPI00035151F9|nr:hypothetical protein Phi39:1_gp34 [Cellulophaga phage phi39:1]AGO49149.1 hypothetical protein Phi39:1_gp34 [Cellulophaga phage phi39:1]